MDDAGHAPAEPLNCDVARGASNRVPSSGDVPLRAAKTASELGLPLDDVVILFACNERFTPYLSVTLQSAIEHVDPARRYDVIVLSNDITPQSMQVLHDQVARDNVGIGFLDAVSAMGGIKLPRHGHFAVETYYRLLAPELLDRVEKVVYLDSDLVVLRDLAELYDTDVTGCLLAATRDADTAGQCDGYDSDILPYLRDVVKLDDPHSYFQAGVLLLNLEEFRKEYSTSAMIELAASRHWHWLDQDVLNHLARGEYVRLATNWNLLADWQKLRRTHIIGCAPEEIRAEYETARLDPYIVHYAGPDDRPWLYPECDFGDLFWDFASRCPFYGELQRRLDASRRSVTGLAKRFQVLVLFKIGQPLADLLLPPNTRRRAFFVRIFHKVAEQLM